MLSHHFKALANVHCEERFPQKRRRNAAATEVSATGFQRFHPIREPKQAASQGSIASVRTQQFYQRIGNFSWRLVVRLADHRASYDLRISSKVLQDVVANR